MTKLSTQPYKGTRDFYPEEFAKRQYLFDAWTRVCQKFGYEQYDTPILEPLEIYASKTSDEIVGEESFLFTDRGGREVMMRPEMTPSVSRLVAGKRQELGYPLRLFSIPNCFRYERPQKGRLREFWQLNVDLFGVESSLADAEMVQISDAILKELGIKEEMYNIQISDRGILDWLLQEKLNLDEDKTRQTVRIMDKKAKLGDSGFNLSLREVGLNKEEITLITEVLQAKSLPDFPEGCKDAGWYKNLSEVFSALDAAKVKYTFNPEITRGFDYYTGFVYEVFDTDPKNNRSMFGGGRYNGLVSNFGVEELAVTGFGMGDAVVSELMNSKKLWPEFKANTDVMLLALDEEGLPQVGKFAEELRKAGKNVAIDYNFDRKLDKRIKAAEKLRIPEVGFIGPDEIKSGKVTFKKI